LLESNDQKGGNFHNYGISHPDPIKWARIEGSDLHQQQVERMFKMPEAQTVQEVVDQVVVGTTTEQEKAIALHDYVRERVQFGFNKYFDATPPNYTLTCKHGHCNPKSRLMVTLFQAVGLESYQHFVVIPKDILKDAIPPSRYWMIPAELCHSYTEVKVNGKWCSLDSYIVDSALLKGGLILLARESRPRGYGVRTGSINIWDGQSDAFSQFDRSMMIEDHGRVEDLEAYFHDKRYRHHMLGLPFNTMIQWMGETGVASMNTHIDRIRQVN